MTLPRMTMRQRGSFAAHLWKASTQQHHSEMTPIFAPYIQRDSVVLDVGAHAGQYTKLLAKLCPEGEVHAFEPSAYARAILNRVVRWRSLRNVQIVAAGLSDEPGALELATPLKRRGSFGFGLAHFGEEERFDSVWRNTVPVTTIDRYCAETPLSRVDFIKADIEGWEVKMLAGAAETLRSFRPVVFVELVDSFLERADTCAADAFQLMKPLGYRTFALGRDAALRPVDGYDGPDDYLFVPDRGP